MRQLRVLFIGNSFTTRNDVPALWAGLAADGDRGTDIESRVVAAGGASLRQHLNKGEATGLLNEERWDYVVLQEQSTLPVKNPSRTGDNVRDFHALVCRTDAETVLYMTWARSNAPESQDQLRQTYDELGSELGATVIPAGLAWAAALATERPPVLHDKDGSHPTLAGSYLAACAFQYTLLGDPVGEPQMAADKLPADQRQGLRDAARRVCASRVGPR